MQTNCVQKSPKPAKNGRFCRPAISSLKWGASILLPPICSHHRLLCFTTNTSEKYERTQQGNLLPLHVHTYTLEKLTLLLFSPSVHGKFWKMCKTQKKKNTSFHYIVPRTVQVQYIFEERHRSMKENCLWGRCKKKNKKKLTIQHFRLNINTYLLVFFTFFSCTFP